ncbi:sporulation membrane protein YtaF [Paradesulfitobacterium ferrireducens]|uniref:sporulation membrane protein YtaF n=1 Tax=Paradesulfitobacterium ferrireducens TaxID=2816476 RepID=UPI001A90943B|nr:sporulation membrane protein YtaF [Paradesulfitobacterium ferrireducens]
MGTAILMAIALSLDGFGVGLAYGLRRIRIPITSMGVIALCTVAAMGISMLFGNWMVLWLELFPAHYLGAGILLGLGSFQLVKALRQDRREPVTVPAIAPVYEDSDPEPLFQLEFLGLIIQVMRSPDLADMDRSGGISLRESFLLGTALAVDAFASGIGAALAGMTISLIVIVAFTQMGMLKLGQQLAGKVPEALMNKAQLLPGIVLILVGIGKIF